MRQPESVQRAPLDCDTRDIPDGARFFCTSTKFAMSKAKQLKRVLRENGHDISHGRATHVFARMLGYRDWNELNDRQYVVLPSPFDHDCSEQVVDARKRLQKKVLIGEGVDSDLSDRVVDVVRPSATFGIPNEDRPNNDMVWDGFDDIDY